MTEKENIRTDTFRLALDPAMDWYRLPRPDAEIYRIRYRTDHAHYTFEISVLDHQAGAREAAERKFSINHHSAFDGENIPPHRLEKQQHHLTAWGCRYRWVDGGVAPYRCSLCTMKRRPDSRASISSIYYEPSLPPITR